MTSTLEIQAANAKLLAPSAAELMVEIENGDTDAAIARIQELGRSDFIQVFRAVQTLEKALSSYAASWQNSCYWGNGESFPDEQAKAAIA